MHLFLDRQLFMRFQLVKLDNMFTRKHLVVGFVTIICLGALFLHKYDNISKVSHHFQRHLSQASTSKISPTQQIIEKFNKIRKRKKLVPIDTHGASEDAITPQLISNKSNSIYGHFNGSNTDDLVIIETAESSTATESSTSSTLSNTKLQNKSQPSEPSPATPSVATPIKLTQYTLPTINMANCFHDVSNFVLSLDNLFLYHSLCKIKNEMDLVNFRGQRNYLNMGLDFSHPHVLIKGNTKIRVWSDLTKQVDEKLFLKPEHKAIHVHNELKIGDFLHFIVKEYIRNTPKQTRPSFPLQGVVPMETEGLTAVLDKKQAPIVLTNSIDENWGFLSTCIANRTTCWINMTNHLLIHNSNYHTVKQVLDSDKITLMVVNSHVDPVIGAHNKVIALPLGLRAKVYVFTRALNLLNTKYKKTILLTINNSGWGNRKQINEMVSAAFNHTVQNTYTSTKRITKLQLLNFKNETVLLDSDHYSDIAQSQFVLCPSGLGFDTYRLWEILLLGSIPIVESNAGFDRTYAHLPVLVVRNYKYVTPELLTKAYPCFVKNVLNFRYEHLTLSYWSDLVSTAVCTGSIEHITEAHPFRNKYCDFLDDM